MSSFDLSMVMQLAQDEIDAKNERGNYSESSGNNYPLVYPIKNGKLTMKLLFNPKAGIVQRKIIRHGKVPCLQMYGMECPVCSAISQVEEVKGKDAGAWSKHGYKVRGICYAQIIDHDPAYFTDDKDPKKGDIVLLMYPKSIFDDINNLFIDSGANLDQLVASNEGFPIVITRSMKSNGFPEYNTSISIGKVKSFQTDEEFNDKLAEIPDLNETIVPKFQSDKVLEDAKALGETIVQEYMSSSMATPPPPAQQSFIQQTETFPKVDPQAPAVSNPLNNPTSSATPAPVQQSTTVQQQPVVEQATVTATTNAAPNTGSKPACFGQHKDNDKQCLICPFDDECFNAMNNG